MKLNGKSDWQTGENKVSFTQKGRSQEVQAAN
jgi:hypothetical protein